MRRFVGVAEFGTAAISVAVGRSRSGSHRGLQTHHYYYVFKLTMGGWRERKAVFVSGIAQPPDQIMEHLNGICWTISNGPNIRSGALFLSFFLSERTLPPPNIITILCCIIKGDCKIFGVIDGMAASALAPARLHSPEF